MAGSTYAKKQKILSHWTIEHALPHQFFLLFCSDIYSDINVMQYKLLLVTDHRSALKNASQLPEKNWTNGRYTLNLEKLNLLPISKSLIGWKNSSKKSGTWWKIEKTQIWKQTNYWNFIMNMLSITNLTFLWTLDVWCR